MQGQQLLTSLIFQDYNCQEHNCISPKLASKIVSSYLPQVGKLFRILVLNRAEFAEYLHDQCRDTSRLDNFKLRIGAEFLENEANGVKNQQKGRREYAQEAEGCGNDGRGFDSVDFLQPSFDFPLEFIFFYTEAW